MNSLKMTIKQSAAAPFFDVGNEIEFVYNHGKRYGPEGENELMTTPEKNA